MIMDKGECDRANGTINQCHDLVILHRCYTNSIDRFKHRIRLKIHYPCRLAAGKKTADIIIMY